MFCGTELDLKHEFLFCYHGYLYFGNSTLENIIVWYSHGIITIFRFYVNCLITNKIPFPF